MGLIIVTAKPDTTLNPNLASDTMPARTVAHWTIYCDGSAWPNPGRMGLGAVITAPDGSREMVSIADGERGCNNEAELRALMTALDRLDPAQVMALHIYSDNSVLVSQLGGVPPGGKPAQPTSQPPVLRLAALFDKARKRLHAFDNAQLHWVPRHRNVEADTLARAALGLGPKPMSARPRRNL